jgi:hypothetical protein
LDDGYVFTTPVSPELTPDQARDLDDILFSSRPLEYFSTRIAGLLAGATVPETGTALGAEFSRRLGVVEAGEVLVFSADDRALQVAADSYVLRHHVAEALVRLYHALAVPHRNGKQADCLWQWIIDGPKQTADLARAARTHLRTEDGANNFWSLVLPRDTSADDERAATSLNVMGAWLQRAMLLLDRLDIDVNAGHNRAKHGLAVRAVHTQMTLVPGPLTPGAEVPVDVFARPGAVDLINGESLEFLSRPAATGGTAHGWELSTLRLVPSVLLAEAHLMTTTYAAMFHLAATRHFEGRNVEAGSLPTYPALPLAPTPDALLGAALVGLRRPFTLPPDGGNVTRHAAIIFEDGSRHDLEVDVPGRWTSNVVDTET